MAYEFTVYGTFSPSSASEFGGWVFLGDRNVTARYIADTTDQMRALAAEDELGIIDFERRRTTARIDSRLG